MVTASRRFPAAGYALLLTLVITAPLLGSGYLLIRDAVSTPRSYLPDSALGLGEGAPRAVPQDFGVAMLSTVLDGGVVVKALLIGGIFLAGWGAARLTALVLPDVGTAGQLVAVTVAIWNPYVAERLLQGHWSLLVGYGCLPWVAAAVIALRTEQPRRTEPAQRGVARWAPTVFWIALAGLTPTGLIMAAAVGLVCAAVPGAGLSRPRCAAATAGTALLAALPWLVAAAVGNSLSTRQSAWLAPFAARAEPGLGTLGSLAGLGGIWNAEAVPVSRATPFAVVGTVALLAIVVAGGSVVFRRPRAEPLLMLAAASILLPAAMATGPGMAVLRAVVDQASGLAVLRDGQKWVGCAMPGYALAAAGAVVAFRRWVRPAGAALLCCAALLAVSPDLAWGVGGKLHPRHYPVGWAAAARLINAEPQPVAVQPDGMMRRFDWAGTAPVLDPTPRWLRADVLTTGELRISGTTVEGEGHNARAVQRLLDAGASPAALADAGVGWLIVQHDTPGAASAVSHSVRQLPTAYIDEDITLYRIGGTAQGATRAQRSLVIAAHLVWATMLLAGAATMASGWMRRHVVSAT